MIIERRTTRHETDLAQQETEDAAENVAPWANRPANTATSGTPQTTNDDSDDGAATGDPDSVTEDATDPPASQLGQT